MPLLYIDHHMQAQAGTVTSLYLTSVSAPVGSLRRNNHVTTRLRGRGQGKDGRKKVLDTPSAPYSDIVQRQGLSKCRPYVCEWGVCKWTTGWVYWGAGPET